MFSPTSVFHTIDFTPSTQNESGQPHSNLKAQPNTDMDTDTEKPPAGVIRRLLDMFDAAAAKPAQETPNTTTMDVKDVFFTQSTIQSTFSNGTSLEETVDKIKNGDMSIDDLTTIRVVEVDGTYYSLDNRRLHVMKTALKGRREDNRQIKVQVVKLTDVDAKHPDRTCRANITAKLEEQQKQAAVEKQRQAAAERERQAAAERERETGCSRETKTSCS